MEVEMHDLMEEEDDRLKASRGHPDEERSRDPEDGTPQIVFDILHAHQVRAAAGMGRFFPLGRGTTTISELRDLIASVK